MKVLTIAELANITADLVAKGHGGGSVMMPDPDNEGQGDVAVGDAFDFKAGMGDVNLKLEPFTDD